MTIWEIDNEILSLVDQETGELLDFDRFAELQMERDRKIENMACWSVNLNAEAAAIREQEKILKERREKTEARAERVKRYLDQFLGGEKFSTPKVAVSYRKTPAHVEVDGEFMAWAAEHDDSFLRYKEPEINKKAVADAIKAGQDVPHAWMADGGYSISIK